MHFYPCKGKTKDLENRDEDTREEDMRKHLENIKLAAIGCGVLSRVIWVDQRRKIEILGIF